MCMGILPLRMSVSRVCLVTRQARSGHRQLPLKSELQMALQPCKCWELSLRPARAVGTCNHYISL